VPSEPIPAPTPGAASTARGTAPNQTAEIDRSLRRLGSTDERARADAMVELGRLRANQAVEPLKQALATDRSPMVREAAARGLGLIGAPSSLTALQTAAQADDDRDVRASARFAADVIRSRLPR
jgi:HEAT repeat protein